MMNITHMPEQVIPATKNFVTHGALHRYIFPEKRKIRKIWKTKYIFFVSREVFKFEKSTIMRIEALS